MQLWLRLGAQRDGTLTAIDMRVLSDTGAYGTHGLTVTGSSGYKTLIATRRSCLRSSAR